MERPRHIAIEGGLLLNTCCGATEERDECIEALSTRRGLLVYLADLDRVTEIAADGWPLPDFAIEPRTFGTYRYPAGASAPVSVIETGHDMTSAISHVMDNAEGTLASLVVAGRCELGTTEPCRVILPEDPRQVSFALHGEYTEAARNDRLYFAHLASHAGILAGLRWFEAVFHATPEAPNRLGATPVSRHRTSFRVWAPRRQRMTVRRADGREVDGALQRHANGYFTGTISGIGVEDDYIMQIDGERLRPDPASRFQPYGVHKASRVTSSYSFPVPAADWRGNPKSDLVIYEIHVGSFTPEGTFRAAIRRLDSLRQLGINAVEVMPVAQAPGRWTWGYDGVQPYAVNHNYGSPDDFKAFVDAAHERQLAVLLDVVYNHLGPEGNYLADYAAYFSRRHHTPWGDAFGFDARQCSEIRRYVVENAVYWLREFHLDGLRLDAVHFMHDTSDYTILDEIRDGVRASISGRHIHLIAEANLFDHDLAVGNASKDPYDAIWCDDLMHAIYSVGVPDFSVTERRYRGASDVAEALEHGFLYTGPTVSRATPASREKLQLSADREYLHSLVIALQTHDAVGNHPHGKRIAGLVSREFQMAAAALVLLYPGIPLIFMGEEDACEGRFAFFADFEDASLRRRVDRGRARQFSHDAWVGALVPSDRRTFEQARCPSGNKPCDVTMWQWYRELLQLRHYFRQRNLLQPANLTSSYDANSNLFQLRYSAAEGEVVVASRIGPPKSRDSANRVEVQLAGHEVVARSSPHTNECSLGMNEAFVALQSTEKGSGLYSVVRTGASRQRGSSRAT